MIQTNPPAPVVAGERFNTLTHLFGFALAIAGCASLLHRAASGDGSRGLAGAAVFGFSMVMLYGCSVLFHSTRGRRKRFFERADHAAIYLLIAGTFTPFPLVAAPGWVAASMLLLVWSLTATGIAKELRVGPSRAAPLRLYLAIGWASLIGAVPFAAAHSSTSLAWLVAGGIAYAAGTRYYRNPAGRPHAHGIWHLFVLAGSACHFLAVDALLV
ncbi:conserved membrane hypothetical protein [Burkholderiales bacterium 8X]|nr:conserved membrane hypothetical protein [Burkholderiales bacterium 8X]